MGVDLGGGVLGLILEGGVFIRTKICTIVGVGMVRHRYRYIYRYIRYI